MIKRLRIKFVCVIMAIVMLMLGGILGVVIFFTGRSMEMQSINMMRSVAAGPQQHGPMDKPGNEIMLPFFTVRITDRGELFAQSNGYFDLSDEDELQQIVDAATESGKETGKLSIYHLRYLIEYSPAGQTIVFADTTTETATLRNLIFSCLIIFFSASVVFLVISILLSQWVIRPVENAWNQQRQFVADASHELKTPLSVIMANAELLQNEQIDEQEQKRFSGSILSMSYQMRTLVENMLEMARVDNGSVKMHFTDVELSQLVSDAVLSFQLLYKEKNLTLLAQVQEGISLHGSEQHLFQVMDVLLDNARKYSASGGTVVVSLRQNGRNCLLTVSSPGEPIAKEDLKNIFKRFYRVDKARTRNGSYGLGLPIAEGIVAAHKGKIWAESKNGKNMFFVQLPTVHFAPKDKNSGCF